MSKPRLNVIIPSRSQPRQAEFLRRAVRSLRAQSILDQIELRVVVGLDKGAELDAGLVAELALQVAHSEGASQAAALNAAIRVVDGDVVAFLEDDDEWMPTYLQNMLGALRMVAFASSTQLEIDDNDAIVRIVDFPTPSGWLMPMSTLRAVGPFSEAYRWHLDHEWLGRLSETALPRAHLVECTAPGDPSLVAQIRPWLANVLTLSGGRVRLARHESPYPLVRRRVHAGSGMGQIGRKPELREESSREYAQLNKRFGRVPW